MSVLLSGRSGARLSSLSDGLQSKQYIKLLSYEHDDGRRNSMVQRVLTQLEQAG